MKDSQLTGCQCPHGFRGDGHKCEGAVHLSWLTYATPFGCSGSQKKKKTSLNFLLFLCSTDVNECKEHLACQCDGCTCKNTWGGYDCKCKGNLLYIMEQDICIGKTLHVLFLSFFFWIIIGSLFGNIIKNGKPRCIRCIFIIDGLYRRCLIVSVLPFHRKKWF